MEVKEIAIEKIKAYGKNPRKNDQAVDAVANSIKEFGWKQPLVIDPKTMEIVVGHTRWKAAKKLGMKTVPCIMADDLTEEQIKAYRLADNKTNELAEWDFDLLGEELDGILDLDMTDFGFDFSEQEAEKEVTEDIPPEVDEENESTCKLGDIWQLGEHRLMCGDSTDRAMVERLMDGKKADMVFTDPPYGMKKEKDGVANDNLNYDDLLEFNKQWIPLTFDTLKDNGSWYCWGIDEPLMDIYSEILKPMIKVNKITFRNLITWDKGNGQGQLSADFRMYPIADEKCLFVMCGVQGFNNNSDNYFEAWEPIRKYIDEGRKQIGLDTRKKYEAFLGSTNKSQHHFSTSYFNLILEKDYRKLKAEADKQRKEGLIHDAFKREYDDIKREYYATRAYFDNTHDNMNNVWHFSRTDRKERELTGGHATPKPIALCARAIKSSSRESETVLDLFGGSGSTLIACEQMGRKCYMMEIDPKYCDVIVKRWENLTGRKAVRLNE